MQFKYDCLTDWIMWYTTPLWYLMQQTCCICNQQRTMSYSVHAILQTFALVLYDFSTAEASHLITFYQIWCCCARLNVHHHGGDTISMNWYSVTFIIKARCQLHMLRRTAFWCIQGQSLQQPAVAWSSVCLRYSLVQLMYGWTVQELCCSD